jgi:hypothetical protein
MAKPKADRKAKGEKPKTSSRTVASLRPKAGPGVAKAKTGRPHGYTEAIGIAICDLVAQRVSVVTICAMEGMPSKDTLYRWKREIVEFSDMYAHAREHRADARQDYIEEILEETKTGKIDPQVARLIIDTEKWMMGKEKPKAYGDKVALTDADGGRLVIEFAQ